MKELIDARGLACPEPVLLTKKKIKDCNEIEILVDNDTALENISRLAASSGYAFTSEKVDDFYRIIIVRGSGRPYSSVTGESAPACGNGGSVVVLSSAVMGSGDDELGRLLMKAFVHTLANADIRPSTIILYNTGVNLAAEGSGTDDDLAVLAGNGAEVLICGTCADYFNIKNRIKTGIISNMSDILDTMNRAGKLIKP